MVAMNPQVADYREFSAVKVGSPSTTEVFTLNFHKSTTLKSITASADFHVTGGTCSEGHTYSEGNACSVEVAFKPTGAGHRSGQLTIAHSAAARPMVTPIGGTAYTPVVSFIPAQINTVPGTNTGGGEFSNPQGLAIDGGDNLYIADTSNNLVRFIDSSGAIVTLVGGGSESIINSNAESINAKLNAPYGVAVDTFGNVYFADFGDEIIALAYPYGYTGPVVGGATANQTDCSYSSPCAANTVAINPPNSIAVDPSENVYFAQLDGSSAPGSEIAEFEPQNQSNPDFFIFPLQGFSIYSTSNAITIDPFGYGNVYYTYIDAGKANGGILSPTPLCYIMAQNAAYTDGKSGSSGGRYWTVAGSGPCGFSGDGGKATGAEISNSVRGLAWDAAGNFYFTDTNNSRIRRVDGNTGIIRTVAGNGTSGNLGDGGPATSASLSTPIGLAVDSQGKVYTTNVTNSLGQADIRVIGTVGQLTFASQAVSNPSAAKTILLSNTGNDTLNFTHVAITSGNTGDFAIDPNTTSCNFTLPLVSGKSCTIGVIFTPLASGTRTATLTVLDDTVTGSNIVQLTGSGAATNPAKAVLSPTSVAFGSQTVGASTAAQAVTLSNTGGATLNITSLTIIGANPGDFTQTSTCGTTLAAGATCSVSLVFKPTAAGARAATLSVATSVGTPTAALSGTGTTAAATVTISPTSFAFPSQTVGTSSSVQPFTVTNTGTSTLTFNSYGFTGTNASDFITAHSCAATLAAAATCTVNVVFKPAAAGARSANLVVGTTAGTLTVPLTGTAVAAAAKAAITLTSGANPVPAGQSLKLVSRIALALPNRSNTSAPNAPEPTGTVQLMEGKTVLAEATLSNGSATFNLSGLSTGTHILTALYMGDSQHQASQSNLIKQVVGFTSTMPHR
jgi:sugar lactone lactonase YvrE